MSGKVTIRVVKKTRMSYKVSDPRRPNPHTTALRYRVRYALPESTGVRDNLHRVKGGDLREFAGRIGMGVSNRRDVRRGGS